MKQYTLITIGKVKESFCAKGIQEFAKRIKQIEIISLKDSTKEKERQLILDHLHKHNYDSVISLDEHGKQLTSKEFAAFCKKHEAKKICFIIGGPDGIHKDVLNSSKHTIALSKMTFTHDMAQLFFVEQLYRAQSINEGKKYHRE